MVLVQAGRLRETVLGILLANDVPSSAALLQTETLVAAELRGHPSHGVLRCAGSSKESAPGSPIRGPTGRHEWAGTARGAASPRSSPARAKRWCTRGRQARHDRHQSDRHRGSRRAAAPGLRHGHRTGADGQDPRPRTAWPRVAGGLGAERRRRADHKRPRRGRRIHRAVRRGEGVRARALPRSADRVPDRDRARHRGARHARLGSAQFQRRRLHRLRSARRGADRRDRRVPPGHPRHRTGHGRRAGDGARRRGADPARPGARPRCRGVRSGVERLAGALAGHSRK